METVAFMLRPCLRRYLSAAVPSRKQRSSRPDHGAVTGSVTDLSFSVSREFFARRAQSQSAGAGEKKEADCSASFRISFSF